MEEVDQITLANLRLLGCDFEEDSGQEDEITSLAQLSPAMMVEATARCLEAINGADAGAYAHHLPPSMAARFKVGQALAQAVREIGYRGEVGYQTFLYPNSRDSRNLLMFLVERLPKDTAGQTGEEILSSAALLNHVIAEAVKASLGAPWLPVYCKPAGGLRPVGKGGYSVEGCAWVAGFRSRPLLVPEGSWREENPVNLTYFRALQPVHKQVADGSVLAASLLERSVLMLEGERCGSIRQPGQSSGDQQPSGMAALVAQSLKASVESATKLQNAGVRPAIAPKPSRRPKDTTPAVSAAAPEVTETKEERKARLEAELAQLRDQLSEQNALYDQLTGDLDRCSTEMTDYEGELDAIGQRADGKEKEVTLLTKTHSLLPDAPENVGRLREHIDKKQAQIVGLAEKWEEHRGPLIDELRELREAARTRQSTADRCRQQLADIHGQLEECRVEFKAKEEKAREFEKRLSAAATKKAQTRSEFTKRILDITENNKKQKVEIGRVIGEIVALQREINMLRGKLDRTFTVTENLLFRDAKTDEANRKMYKMLAGIHENCGLLVGVIEEKGRLIREIRELEDMVENESRKKTDDNLAKIMRDFDEIKASNKKLKHFIKSSAAGQS